MSTPNYKLAAKLKYRFDSPKGQLSVDELYGLTLEQLDAMAQALDKKLKEANGSNSFIRGASGKNSGVRTDTNKLAILIDVIQTKESDADKKKDRAEKSAKLSNLRQLLAEKMTDDIRAKSTDEIAKMIAAIEDGDEYE